MPPCNFKESSACPTLEGKAVNGELLHRKNSFLITVVDPAKVKLLPSPRSEEANLTL
jgi:hypothetical protein